MWQCEKSTVESDTSQTTTKRMRFACWIPKATNIHSEYVLLIAFLPQQWFQERAALVTCLIEC